MIIFHEGLPGSGKSYEALVRRIIPELAKGRAVDAYVEGLNHEKIAELAGISVERCKELLRSISREDVKTIATTARDNALIVLDEAQNFWGTSSKLSKEVTQFVTEHRHRGIDIVLMGQSMKDVNALWRRRVELKLCFVKLSGIGAATRYSVTTWRHLGDDKYSKVSMDTGKYDPKYFGSYASHVSDNTNTADYKDSRATVFGSKLFKVGIPLAFILAILGGWYVYRFFHPNIPPGNKPSQATLPTTRSAQASAWPVAAAKVAVPADARQMPASVPANPVVDQPRSAIEGHMAKLAGNRLRLAGMIRMGDRVSGIVEWISGDMRVMERMSLDGLRELGVAVLVRGDSVQLAVGEWSALATPWPLDGEVRVSENRQREIRDASPDVAMSASQLQGRPRDVAEFAAPISVGGQRVANAAGKGG